MIKEGQVLGKWTAISREGRKVTCRCECGTVKKVWSHNLLSGKSLSCGCSSLHKTLSCQKGYSNAIDWLKSIDIRESQTILLNAVERHNLESIAYYYKKQEVGDWQILNIGNGMYKVTRFQ